MDISAEAATRLQVVEAQQPPAATRDAARYMLRVRRAAKTYFGSHSMSEPAWKLMLALYSADSAKGCNIGWVATRADIPRSTALRWLTALDRDGYVRLAQDPADRRAVRVRISERGLDALQRSFVAARFDTR